MLPPNSKFFIFGSCVTRDVFGSDLSRHVSTYLARSSLAAQMGQARTDERILEAIVSPFQRQMVQADMESQLWPRLLKDESDLIIIDFIDDRFDMLRIDDDARFTTSSEYMIARKSLQIPVPDPAEIMKWNSPEKLELWKAGWARLCDMLAAAKRLDRLVVNKVFWSERLPDGSFLNGGNIRYIHQANDYLRLQYEHIEQATPGLRALAYSHDMFRADPEHRWGLSAFHYIPDFYASARNQLAALSCRALSEATEKA